MYKKTEEILNRINDLETNTAIIRSFLNQLKEEIDNINNHLESQEEWEKLFKERAKETAEKFCYRITESEIITHYEDPKYILKHIKDCLRKNIPFTLNENAKNYWLEYIKNKAKEKNSTDLAEKFGLRKNETFTWR